MSAARISRARNNFPIRRFYSYSPPSSNVSAPSTPAPKTAHRKLLLAGSVALFVGLAALAELACFAVNRTCFKDTLDWHKRFATRVIGPIAEPDPDLLWRLAPGSRDDINSLGFRGPELPPDLRPRKIVLLLGDSTAFGWGLEYEDTIGVRLQQRFDAVRPGEYYVVNAGVPGYSTYQTMRYCQQLLGRMRPHVVLTYVGANDCWSEGNTLRDAEKPQHFNPAATLPSFLQRSNVVKTITLARMRWGKAQRRLRVLPSEYQANLDTIGRLARKAGARHVHVNPLFNDREQYYLRPQDLLRAVGQDRFYQGQDRALIEKLSDHDYIRADGVMLTALMRDKPKELFFDYWHPTKKGAQEIANIIFEALMAAKPKSEREGVPLQTSPPAIPLK